MIWSSHDTMVAGSSSGSGVSHELVWPCPSEPRKAWFILHDEEEVKLWHLLGKRGLSMESNLTLTKARLKEDLERVELIHQAMTVDLPRIAEVSSLCFWCCPSLFGLSIVVSACQLLVSQDLEMMSIRKS